MALALRDECRDLEAAGIRVIQVDEPALRETLPLRAADQPAYLDWAVGAFRLATGVGPGVWDIHSPRVPSHDEVVSALRRAVAAVPARRVWVNPDCGLKTRGYPEVEASLQRLVAAAVEVRES